MLNANIYKLHFTCMFFFRVASVQRQKICQRVFYETYR